MHLNFRFNPGKDCELVEIMRSEGPSQSAVSIKIISHPKCTANAGFQSTFHDIPAEIHATIKKPGGI
jgi:hypothetical protein